MKEEQKVHNGEVIWFKLKPGLGFLKWFKDGKRQTDMFCHYSDIAEQEGFKLLKSKQKVEFTIGENHKGQPKATNVRVIK